MLEALANRLTSASICTLATDLFLGYLPEDPDLCVGLFEYAGSPPRETMEIAAASVDVPSVQVMVRGGDYVAARTKAVAVRDSLTSIANETISGVRFLRVSQRSAINSMGRDTVERPMFTLALEVMVER